jgi:PAS domain S-box-containing protein
VSFESVWGRSEQRAELAERAEQESTERERRLQAEIVVLRSSGETDAIMRGILDAAPDAMMLVNRHGVIEAANLQAERMFRYAPGAMRGTPVDELVPMRLREMHAGHRAAYMESPSVRPMGLGMALFAQRSDGSELSVEISLSPYLATGEYPKVVCSVRDMTGRARDSSMGVH